MKKRIIVLREDDARHGGLVFEKYCTILPKPWSSLPNYEMLKVERRGAFWHISISGQKKRLLIIPNSPLFEAKQSLSKIPKSSVRVEEEKKSEVSKVQSEDAEPPKEATQRGSKATNPLLLLCGRGIKSTLLTWCSKRHPLALYNITQAIENLFM